MAAYNKLNDPNRIEIGQSLKIRPAWLRTQTAKTDMQADKATVEAITGRARSNGKPVRVGDALAAGIKLDTSAGAALRLRLPDGSIINMLERTVLQLEKLEQSQAESFKTVLRLVSGHVEAFKKKYPGGRSDLAFHARASTISVRGISADRHPDHWDAPVMFVVP
ncbi:MAG: hypothetical protein EPO42_10720 [Gallionellaceae bacterium]|nr:MAG: hypothetical protein EPO42_10720 [Gallionellaceae bacterium]